MKPAVTFLLYAGKEPWENPEVFDFIRCSENKNELKELVENNRYFRHMDEEAFDVAVGYASASELKVAKEKYADKGGINMCTAIQEMMADSRAEGRLEGRAEGIQDKQRQIIRNMLSRGMSDEDIMALAECSREEVDKVRHS
jgi:hypothetical protein